ncbi:MAG: tRNA (guanosine(46)-N7)-methyltransferase TrmB, partial [Sphingorhabdus sp.]
MTAHKEGDPTTLNRLYGRAKGKKLRTHQQHLVDHLLPQISVPLDGAVAAEVLFGYDRPLHFEIGFGGGEHMAYRANMLPDHGFIGCEPFET